MATSENLLQLNIIIPLLTGSLLFAWCITALLNRAIAIRWLVPPIFAIGYGMSLLPIQHTRIAEYIQGFVGHLSIPSMVLIIAHVVSMSTLNREFQDEKNLTFQLIFWTGAFLYPFSLGFHIYDPYALGYHPVGLGSALFITAVFSWWLEKYLIMMTILLCITVFTLNIGDSRNLWDYLIDPLLFLYAIFWLTHQTLFNRHKATPHE